MTKDLTIADCYIGTGTDFIIIMKDTKTSRVFRCQTLTSTVRLKVEGCRVKNGGCRIKSEECRG